ncbi:MAG: hypothetical protein RQ754_00780 [Desulfuromonadales bacterium]|nr:hypothetical protein [Desulfuromonadales bacterium]
MNLASKFKSAQARVELLTAFCIIWLLCASTLYASAKPESQLRATDGTGLLDQFGTIVYQTQHAAAARLYIIANGHRSAIRGAGAAETLQAQIETFRIGEWLISQNRIDVLLPEGFFGEAGTASTISRDRGPLDNQVLQTALADTSVFVNAELLLHRNYGIGLHQIEDRTLYRQVRDRLRSSRETINLLSPGLNEELAYLQKLRTARILQAAPDVIESAYQQGRIEAPNAMLTIGLSHLEDIIAFLEAGEINMAALSTTDSDHPPRVTELESFKSRVNVTVIVPNSLTDYRI